MHKSEYFSKGNSGLKPQFWTEYGRIAKQTDEEFLKRYNGDLDVQLIFALILRRAGLFSAVSSTFIVDMGTALQPDPVDITNALLTFLIEASYNKSVPLQLITTSAAAVADLPLFVIWTQGLAYTSLCLSLLAAFAAVLGKQW
ncbi:hypothetical protein M422DRAFT_160342, partial [Sphaerobolus stellatus SS14]